MTATFRCVPHGATLRRLALTALAAATVAVGGRSAALAVDDASWNAATGHWYAYVATENPSTWDACRDAATAAGGRLATITSAEEQTWIFDNLGIALRPAAWLGATDSVTEGTWEWTGADAWTFTNWAAGEPSDAAGTENWLAMASDGTWSDEPATQTLSGYVVEWDSDPNPQPPAAPMNLVASYAQGAGVALRWFDASSTEQGFVVERTTAGQPWSVRRTTDADVTAWTDFSLFPSTTYTYRVSAFSAGGASGTSNEVTVTTSAGESLPPPPLAPSGLVASAAGPTSIQVGWTDNSVDEMLVDLERSVGGSAFAKAANLPADTVSYADETVHPGWPYRYRVRMLAAQGPSAFSNVATVVVPPTVALTLSSGTLTRATKPGRDTIRVGASITAVGVPEDAPFDPSVQGLEMQLGPASAPAVVSIPAGDAGWKTKVRKGQLLKATWKSRKGVSPKVSVTVDLVHGTVKATVSGADFAQDPSADVRLLFACGTRCGGTAATWSQRKPGVLEYR
jgi:hypothetical protein